MYTISDLRTINNLDNLVTSVHCQKRLLERKFSVCDVITAINNGRIIEEYPEDYPFPSCLISGKTSNNRPIHVVVSMENDTIYLITVYEPSETKWEDNYRKRRASNNEMH